MPDTNTKKTAADLWGLAPLFQVFDMPASLHFYCNVLGFEIISTAGPETYFHWVLLRLNNVELMLEPAYPEDKRPPVPDAARIASHHDTAIYFGCPDIDAVYTILRANGIDTKEPRIAYYGMKQLYVSDPDGYLLCFQWPSSQQTFDQWRDWYGQEFSNEKYISPDE